MKKKILISFLCFSLVFYVFSFCLITKVYTKFYMKLLQLFGEILILGHFQGLASLNREIILSNKYNFHLIIMPFVLIVLAFGGQV